MLQIIHQEISSRRGCAVHSYIFVILKNFSSAGRKLGNQIDLSILQCHIESFCIIDDLQVYRIYLRRSAPVILIFLHLNF